MWRKESLSKMHWKYCKIARFRYTHFSVMVRRLNWFLLLFDHLAHHVLLSLLSVSHIYILFVFIFFTQKINDKSRQSKLTAQFFDSIKSNQFRTFTLQNAIHPLFFYLSFVLQLTLFILTFILNEFDLVAFESKVICEKNREWEKNRNRIHIQHLILSPPKMNMSIFQFIKCTTI